MQIHQLVQNLRIRGKALFGLFVGGKPQLFKQNTAKLHGA